MGSGGTTLNMLHSATGFVSMHSLSCQYPCNRYNTMSSPLRLNRADWTLQPWLANSVEKKIRIQNQLGIGLANLTQIKL